MADLIWEVLPALLIKISILSSRWSNWLAHSLTESKEAKFIFITSTWWPVSFVISLAHVLALSTLRHNIITFAPFFDSSWAVTFPMPLFDPENMLVLVLLCFGYVVIYMYIIIKNPDQFMTLIHLCGHKTLKPPSVISFFAFSTSASLMFSGTCL